MRKQEFLDALRARLSGLPKQEVEERLGFYAEMIDDRIEEGLAEEEAVSAIGSVNEIAGQIIADVPLAKIAKEKIKPKRRLRAWEIVLLALGSPIWISLAAAALAVIFAIYVSLWAVIISVWAAFGSLIAGALGGAAASVIFICQDNAFTGIAAIGAGIVCAGLAIFMFFGCKAATKGTLLLTKSIIFSIKKRLVGKEEA